MKYLLLVIALFFVSCGSIVGERYPSSKQGSVCKRQLINGECSIGTSMITAIDGHDYVMFTGSTGGGVISIASVHSPDCRKCATRTLVQSSVDTLKFVRFVLQTASADSDSIQIKMCSPERWKQIMEQQQENK